MLTIVIFILVISVLVLVHELGHFLTARRLGVAVEEFGFGFPPRLIGFRRGATIYSLNWIPFGGFVRMKGELPGSAAEPDSFSAQPPGKRLIILAAGVVMNYLLTILLLTIGLTAGLPSTADASLAKHLTNVKPQIIEVEPGSPAVKAGLAAGDVLVRADSTPIANAATLRDFQNGLTAASFNLTVQRNGQERTVTVTPTKTAEGDLRIGVAVLNVGTLSYPFPQSLWEGTRSTINVTGQIFASFGGLLRDLVVDRKVSPDLSGPVGIVVLTGQAYRLGFAYLLQFVALLSATLAVFNFFPLPALDGGRALFVVIESVRRRAINQRTEAAIHAIGFYILIALVLLVSLRDVDKFNLGTKLVTGLKSLFGH